MTSVIVDTNVGVVANGRDAHASPTCMIACVDALEQIVQGEDRLVLDADWEILQEYLRHMRSTGQPGPGDVFLKWALTNWTNPDRCECVPLERTADGYARFPADPDLVKFDPSDRKFVALALTSDAQPPILNAVDSGWWEFRVALQRVGVEVRFLCPEELRKHGRQLG